MKRAEFPSPTLEIEYLVESVLIAREWVHRFEASESGRARFLVTLAMAVDFMSDLNPELRDDEFAQSARSYIARCVANLE
jgi:hypothetical protein